VVRSVRGVGLMLGIELAPEIKKLPGDADKPASARMANVLHNAGLMLVPSGPSILRLLPPLNLKKTEAGEALEILESVAAQLT